MTSGHEEQHDELEENVESPAMPGWIRLAAIAALAAGLIAYLAIAVWGNEAKWGPRGDAVGPFAALFNAGALFAALWAVHLQRAELALQRRELQETREEMVEQRKQFERTAEAQEALAASQARLADGQADANQVNQRLFEAQERLALEQVQANKIALRSQLAQRHATIATLQAAIANINAAITTSWNPGNGDERAKKDLAGDLHALRTSLNSERDIAAALVDLIEPLDQEKLT